ncbi:MAG: response regulator transcription factor [Caldilineaceae bacterium]
MNQSSQRREPGPYSVVLVEDEIVARVGIRDNVDWAACGFSFSGEASDGEAALPLIEEVQPDVLITDIRMPFMDGLQLTREVRRRFPATRVLILSGYDDFSFAQTAIHLGVVEYLLKPVSARDLERALLRMKALLDSEWVNSRHQDELRQQADEGLELRREGLLLRLCLGDVDPFELQELAPALGMAPRATCWMVLVARIATAASVEPRRLRECQTLLLELGRTVPHVQVFKKDIEEVVALLSSVDTEDLLGQAAHLRDTLATLALPAGEMWVDIGAGGPRQELNEVPFSFAEALQQLDRLRALSSGQLAVAGAHGDAESPERALREIGWPIDRRALDRFLHHGTLGDFESFYSAYARATAKTTSGASRLQAYLLLDVTLAAASFVSELGGEVTEVLPEAARVDALWGNIQSDEQLRTVVRSSVERALEYRDQIAHSSHALLVRRAQAHLQQEFADPNLSLQRVAADAHLSASHFSVVFGRETGETFKGYLTRIRMEYARELLRSTSLAVTEVGRRCGYPDPHYFSSAFKRVCGISPRDFRETVTA